MATRLRHDTNAHKPGETAPTSGIYTVVHAGHRRDHEVTAIQGEEFPLCRVCQGNVNFYPTHPASHLTRDFDLAGPVLQMPKPRVKTAKRGIG